MLYSKDDYQYWDGVVRCKIQSIHITHGKNCDLRVILNTTDVLNDTNTEHNDMSWVYLNEGDPNYNAYLSMLSMAYMMDYDVTFHVNATGSGTSLMAKIGYIVIHKN